MPRTPSTTPTGRSRTRGCRCSTRSTRGRTRPSGRPRSSEPDRYRRRRRGTGLRVRPGAGVVGGSDARWEGSCMPYIFALAFVAAASIAVQLLAIVLVILTRPQPRPFLWAFWLGALILNTAIGVAVLAVFRSDGAFLGNTTSSVSPAVDVVLGAIALAAALFAATRRGRELIGREAERRHATSRSAGPVGDRIQIAKDEVKARAEQ